MKKRLKLYSYAETHMFMEAIGPASLYPVYGCLALSSIQTPYSSLVSRFDHIIYKARRPLLRVPPAPRPPPPSHALRVFLGDAGAFSSCVLFDDAGAFVAFYWETMGLFVLADGVQVGVN